MNNQSMTVNAASSNALQNARKALLLAAIAMLACIAALVINPGNANAAYNITNFAMTPSTTQAGAHPNINYNLDPDAPNADSTGGDDLKKVQMEFAPGLLGNPQAATTKCATANFTANTCPDASMIGTMSVPVVSTCRRPLGVIPGISKAVGTVRLEPAKGRKPGELEASARFDHARSPPWNTGSDSW